MKLTVYLQFIFLFLTKESCVTKLFLKLDIKRTRFIFCFTLTKRKIYLIPKEDDNNLLFQM